MLGFKNFRCARILLSGIELIHLIAKGQMEDRGTACTHAEQFYSRVPSSCAFLTVSSWRS